MGAKNVETESRVELRSKTAASVFEACKPRDEVLKGDLDDAIFHADFGDLISGNAPTVYGNPERFFQNTHPAKQLRKIIEVIFQRLANPQEAGATVRLSTGFGGGKTHTLMVLWHLANNIQDPSIGIELLPAAGRPKQVKVAAVDGGKAGIPTFARHGKITVKSLWGELAYQLGGEPALRALGGTDDPENQPDEPTISEWFPEGAVLLLLDELVIYMATLSERAQGNLLAFLTKLAAVANKRPQTVLVITDTADQRVYEKEATKIGGKVSAAIRLDAVLGKKTTDFDPIGEEAARVIVRRLFERVDRTAAEATSALYHALYQRVSQENPGLIPPNATSPDYARRIVESYPFHPRILDTAQGRLGALQEFNKSRGTLRLFARILRTVWESKANLHLITAGDVDWSSDRIQADLLQRLNRDNFKAAIMADIEGHARDLDGGKRSLHIRVASAVLLESIPLQPSSGLDPAELTLAMLRPDEAGPEPGDALNHLVGVCWHTYPILGGRGWQFRYEPNVIRQIEERMGQIPLEDGRGRLLAEVQGYFSGPTFTLRAWPTSAHQVPESAALQLVPCEDERIAKAVCTYADDGDPKAPIPRRFQNAIVAVTATGPAFQAALERARRLLAADAIEREHKSGESSKLVREQLQRIKPQLLKDFRTQACRAFDRVVLAGGTVYQIEEQFQVPDEQILQRPQGQSSLRRFLDSKGLIYQPGDVLDAGRFLKDILPGTTPLPNTPEVYAAKAVHERFLSAPRLRLLPDGSIVRQTMLKAIAEGKIVVRLADGRVYDADGCVEGPEGARRRVPGMLSTLSLDDTVYVARADSEPTRTWIKVEAQPEEGRKAPPVTPLPPPPPEGVTATTWEKVVEYARTRPIVELRLIAKTPAHANSVIKAVQPLGAKSLSLTVAASGELKEGGSINFHVAGVKPNHPIKPLTIAQTLSTASGDEAVFEAELTLAFEPNGRTGMETHLKQLADSLTDGIEPTAVFEKPHKEKR